MAKEIMLPVWDATADRWLTGPGRSLVDHDHFADYVFEADNVRLAEKQADIAWRLADLPDAPEITDLPASTPGYVPIFVRRKAVGQEEFIMGRLRPVYVIRVEPTGVIVDAGRLERLEKDLVEAPAAERLGWLLGHGGVSKWEWQEKLSLYRVTLGDGGWDYLSLTDIVGPLRQWVIDTHLTEAYCAIPWVRAPSWMVEADLARAKAQAEAVSEPAVGDDEPPATDPEVATEDDVADHTLATEPEVSVISGDEPEPPMEPAPEPTLAPSSATRAERKLSRAEKKRQGRAARAAKQG